MIRFHIFTPFLLAVACLALFSIPKVRAEEAAPTSVVTGEKVEFLSEIEQKTFFLVNEYRKKNKLPALAWSSAILKIAREHSRNMATGEVDFGHDGFGDRVSRLKTAMVGLKGAGENVLKTDDPGQVAEKAVELWLRSPAHLHNIRGDYNYSGMGVGRNDQGVIYFTQLFVKIEPPSKSATSSATQVASPFGLVASPNTRAQP
ncbi:MAG TPA: CAP domain-containing protein [Candidatus Methylacidiphilales bacterium]